MTEPNPLAGIEIRFDSPDSYPVMAIAWVAGGLLIQLPPGYNALDNNMNNHAAIKLYTWEQLAAKTIYVES